jgi:hypothetical protein
MLENNVRKLFPTLFSSDNVHKLGAGLPKSDQRWYGKIDANGFYLGGEPGDVPAETFCYRLPINGTVHEGAGRLLAAGKIAGWVRGRIERR